MFEKFTDKARRVVVLAQEEAKMLNHKREILFILISLPTELIELAMLELLSKMEKKVLVGNKFFSPYPEVLEGKGERF